MDQVLALIEVSVPEILGLMEFVSPQLSSCFGENGQTLKGNLKVKHLISVRLYPETDAVKWGFFPPESDELSL